jgi:DNA-binding MarR family transcriptional regulator
MGGEKENPTDQEREALRAVANLVRLAEPLVFEVWRSHELTIAQVQCLRILSVQDEQAGDLARKLTMSSTSLTRILERLESRELVRRTVDIHDRRRILVQLTDTGRQTVSSLTSWYSSPMFWAIRDMADEDKRVLIEVLTRYSQAVRDCDSGSDSATSLSEDFR